MYYGTILCLLVSSDECRLIVPGEDDEESGGDEDEDGEKEGDGEGKAKNALESEVWFLSSINYVFHSILLSHCMAVCCVGLECPHFECLALPLPPCRPSLAGISRRAIPCVVGRCERLRFHPPPPPERHSGMF